MKSKDQNKDILEIVKELPKYLRTKTGDVYTLIIIKNEWDGNNNAYIATYAKENKNSISTVKHLIRVEASHFDLCVIELEKKLEDLSKMGIVRGENWLSKSLDYNKDLKLYKKED